MRINTVNIHIQDGPSAIVKAFIEGLMVKSIPDDEPPAGTAPEVGVFPKIGEPWPGLDGVYAGLSRGLDGEPDGHLVLLNAVPEKKQAWADAVKWAESLGNGARLPTRFESALLYANLQDKLDTNEWHWTGTQSSEDGAWTQSFYGGRQDSIGKPYEALARAVSRLPL